MSTDPAERSSPPASDFAVDVRAVAKRYDIYSSNFARAADMLTRSPGSRAKPFWALDDVSFTVARGEAVGIVGRNGSGKSTLMQIIAGTLAPTCGEVHIRGRISALLELGSGFNPAFTGKENVYLAGAIQGLSRRSMDERFDDIATFADIGDFMHQPVEVYSSGMHARLAFAVAVCVQPDILIVDEILSVGDAGFQQKCITRMRGMLDAGVTLLFVSHSADMVKSICSKALFLSKGKSQGFGPAGDIVDKYTQSMRVAANERAIAAVAQTRPELANPVFPVNPHQREGTGHARITDVRLYDAKHQQVDAFIQGEPITIEVTFKSAIDIDKLDVVIRVRDKAGIVLFGFTATDEGVKLPPLEAGESAAVRFVFTSPLAPGPHGVGVSLLRRKDQATEEKMTVDHLEHGAAFESLQGKKFVRGKLAVPVFVERFEPTPAPDETAKYL